MGWFWKGMLHGSLYGLTLLMICSTLLWVPKPVSFPGLVLLRSVILFFSGILLSRYTVYMALAPWYPASLSCTVKERVGYRPFVSVLIPAWNEEVGLLSTIKSLLESTYQHMEIVVVNDGSTDGSDAQIRAFLEKYGRELADGRHIPLVYHYQQNGGKGAALNKAISLSRGDILLSIDADCLVAPDAVAEFVKVFRDPKVMAAVGNVKIGNTRTEIGTIQYLEFLFSFSLKRADSLMNTIYIIGGAAGAFRREVFEKLGGYSTNCITEDIELSMRIQNAGMCIRYVPSVHIFTEGAETLQGLMKQRLRWKRGRFQTFWQYRQMFFSLRPEHNKLLCWLILPMAFLGDVQLGFELFFLLILYLFSYFSQDYSAFLSGVLIVSLLFFVQIWENRQMGWRFLLLAPIGWLLLYLCTFVETHALFKSIWMALRRKEVKWQRWSRKGVLD